MLTLLLLHILITFLVVSAVLSIGKDDWWAWWYERETDRVIKAAVDKVLHVKH
jgi:hypothetical protein